MQSIADFFQRYAKAYVNADTAAFSDFISLPSMLLSGDNKTLLMDNDALHSHILSQVEKYRALGVVDAEPILQHQLRLSDQLYFVSLYWRFYQQSGQVLFTCHTSYTLQKSQQDWQVVAIILDDEQAAYNRVSAAQA
ncbi:DUF4440 domain-containing protein [Rheinheimera fenheensis]|uniref:DUF4440 domain-containing protein n=2 Tax=Rheinheimera fenheensis TaxID=3152295 RepID=UPI00325C4D6A